MDSFLSALEEPSASAASTTLQQRYESSVQWSSNPISMSPLHSPTGSPFPLSTASGMVSTSAQLNQSSSSPTTQNKPQNNNNSSRNKILLRKQEDALEHFMKTLDKDIAYDLKKMKLAAAKKQEQIDEESANQSPTSNNSRHKSNKKAQDASSAPTSESDDATYSSNRRRRTHRRRRHKRKAPVSSDSPSSEGEHNHFSMHRSSSVSPLKHASLHPVGSVNSFAALASDVPFEIRERAQRIKAYGIRKRNETLSFIKRYESLLEEKERDRREKREMEQQYRKQQHRIKKRHQQSIRKKQLEKQKLYQKEEQHQKDEEKLISQKIQAMVREQIRLANSLDTLTIGCRLLPLSVEAEMMGFYDGSPFAQGTASLADLPLHDSATHASRRNSTLAINSSQKASSNMIPCVKLIEERADSSSHPVTVCRVERSILSHSQDHSRKVADQFLFDEYFTGTGNLQLQQRMGKSIVNCAAAGINSNTFTYGGTGSGKTYSAFGDSSLYKVFSPKKKSYSPPKGGDEDSSEHSSPASSDSSPHDDSNSSIPDQSEENFNESFSMHSEPSKEGLIPFVSRKLIEELSKRYNNHWEMKISFFEIYMDMTRDLLSPDADYLKDSVYEDPDASASERVKVRGVLKYSVTSYAQILKLLREGWNRRRWSPTDRHDASSRSHTIFSIYTTFFPIENKPQYVLHSKTSIVDLSGSESIGLVKKKYFQNKIDAPPSFMTQQLEDEALSINRSLLQLEIMLKQVVQSTYNRRKKSKKNTFVPYRQSSLTWILGDSLMGNTKSFLLVCISQISENVSLTMNTLRFATAAGKIHTPVTQNRVELWSSLLSKQLTELAEILEALYDVLGLLEGALFQKENLHRKRVLLRRTRKHLAEILRLLNQKEIEFSRETVDRTLETQLTKLKSRKAAHLFRTVLVLVVSQYERGYFDFCDYDIVYEQYVPSLCPELANMRIHPDKVLPLVNATVVKKKDC